MVWVRHRDIHLLTVNQLTYTSDERFNSLHDPDTDVWSLQVRSFPSKNYLHNKIHDIIFNSEDHINRTDDWMTIWFNDSLYFFVCSICCRDEPQIKNVRLRDSGIYECQVGTTPAIGIPIYLSVVRKYFYL